jgi:hypothetical protein
MTSPTTIQPHDGDDFDHRKPELHFSNISTVARLRLSSRTITASDATQSERRGTELEQPYGNGNHVGHPCDNPAEQ